MCIKKRMKNRYISYLQYTVDILYTYILSLPLSPYIQQRVTTPIQCVYLRINNHDNNKSKTFPFCVVKAIRLAIIIM